MQRQDKAYVASCQQRCQLCCECNAKQKHNWDWSVIYVVLRMTFSKTSLLRKC